MSDVDALVAEIRRIDRIAGGYAIVDLDLRAHGHMPDANLIGHHINRVAREFAVAKKALAKAQSECSHAFELIGEAKPPFYQCVRCYLTRAKAP